MIVWFAHVKVGHRQTPHSRKAPSKDGAFLLWSLDYDLLEPVTSRCAACGAG